MYEEGLLRTKDQGTDLVQFFVTSAYNGSPADGHPVRTLWADNRTEYFTIALKKFCFTRDICL